MLYMNETNIFKLIIDTMIMCQNNKLDNKKDACMNIIQKNISSESYERYAPMISLIIDGLKMLSRSDLLKQLKTSKCYLNCIK